MDWELYRSTSLAYVSPDDLLTLPRDDITRSINTMRKQQVARDCPFRIFIRALRAHRLDGPMHCPYTEAFERSQETCGRLLRAHALTLSSYDAGSLSGSGFLPKHRIKYVVRRKDLCWMLNAFSEIASNKKKREDVIREE